MDAGFSRTVKTRILKNGFDGVYAFPGRKQAEINRFT
jgi:hypothetical protein